MAHILKEPLTDYVMTLERENVALRVALQPFADAGNSTSAQYADLNGALCHLTISDLREAARALASIQET